MMCDKQKLGSIVNILDSRRKPLNEQERSKISSIGLYPYIGANNVMGYVDEYLFDEDILCIAEDGGSWGKNQKCATLYSGKTWVNNHAHVVSPKEGTDLRYVMYYLNSADLNKHITGTTRGKLTKTELQDIEVPLPPLQIQQQIADTLDKADSLRRKDQELLQKYDELAQAIFYDMFGDPETNEQGWKVIELDDLIEIKPKSVTPLELNGNKYVGLEHIQKETGELSYAKSTDLKSNKFLFDERSILYGKLRPYLRKVALPNFSGVCSTDILPITPKSSVDKYFVTSILRSQNFTDYATSASVGANLPRVNKDVILSYKTINPPSELQHRYGHQLQRLEEQKELVKRCIDHSEILFEKYLQKYF